MPGACRKFWTILIIFGCCEASQLAKRQKSALKPTDYQILNYALVLEHLQVALYGEGLANFTKEAFTADNFSTSVRSDFSAILTDEQSHVSYYESALQKANQSAVPNCTYNFGVDNVGDFIRLANIFEGIVVSAYLGMETFFNTSSYLVAANTIMTVDARHSAFVRYNALKQKPHPSPYDIPLDFDSIHTLIEPYILDCPLTDAQMPPIPGVKAFPILGYQNTTYPINANDVVVLNTKTVSLQPSKKGQVMLYAAWATHGSPVYVPAQPIDNKGMRFKTTVPKSIAGQSYVFLTACNDSFTDATILAGPAVLEVGD